MREVASSAELRAATDAARSAGAGVGFVPTMGALHAGHRSLLARARAENALVVASVFVNPLQFGPSEDLAGYPRDRTADLAVLRADGTDLAFLPAEGEMWPSPPEVRLRVGGALAERLEGLLRPGHLDGVATVVAKLLHLVKAGALWRQAPRSAPQENYAHQLGIQIQPDWRKGDLSDAITKCVGDWY